MFKALLFSPLVGFVLSGAAVAGDEGGGAGASAVHGARGQEAAALADPRPARADLHRVSFFPRQNDGQKGMGLIMLILIGAAPTAYALNRAHARQHDAGLPADRRRRRRTSSRRMRRQHTVIGTSGRPRRTRR